MSESEPIKAEIIQATPEPTAIQLLQQAISSGISVDAIQKLAELADRQDAKRAAQAFHEAMAEFKAECPVIGKSRGVNEGSLNYRFADLAAIQRVVDPLLQKHGLSYSWDTVFEAGVVVTCTVTHIQGHSRQSTFKIPPVGTKANNDAQKAGSANSYGKRYSLVNALGLVIDEDDDANILKPEHEAPEADVSAPRQPPRADRVNSEEMQWLYNQWLERDGKAFTQEQKQVEFMAWVGVATEHHFPDVKTCFKAVNWSRKLFNECRVALGLVEA